jgi:hypothetical protein
MSPAANQPAQSLSIPSGCSAFGVHRQFHFKDYSKISSVFSLIACDIL